MGDFNQMVGPRSRAPLELRSALQKTFPPGMRIATSDLAFEGRRSIDHVAVSDDLAVESLDVITNMHDGTRLSDHFGIVAELSARYAARRPSAPTEGKGADRLSRAPTVGGLAPLRSRAATIPASSAVEWRCARAVPPSRRTGSASASGSRRPDSRRRCRRRPWGLTPQASRRRRGSVPHARCLVRVAHPPGAAGGLMHRDLLRDLGRVQPGVSSEAPLRSGVSRVCSQYGFSTADVE